MLLIGTVYNTGLAGFTMGSFLKPEEAWNIDTKIDDGKPATGNVLTYEYTGGAGATTCSDLAYSTTVSLSASVYRLDNTGLNCALIFKTGY